MDNNKIQLIGSPCGHHGPYTFYKAFKYHKNGRHKILSLSDFFFVKLWSDSDLMSIGELILLWVDKNSEQVLASLRLYFLPENTPEGRNDDHGEDEVLAISEKVVLRADDLLGWITDEVRWPRGLPAVWERECPGPALAEAPHLISSLLVDSALDLQDVLKEKSLLGEPDPEESGVVVLSFARYCRFRGIMKRLEGVSNKWLHNALVLALGGFAAPCRNTRVLFCKDTFDYPDLEGHEQLCNHLAPNLKGRPRKRPKKRSLSPGGSESNESESSLSTVSSSLRSKQQIPGRNGLRCNSIAQQNSPARGKKVEREVGPDEKEFLVKLHSFMKSRRTPISRVPHLGFKEIDLYAFFTKVQKLGGYNSVTANRLWKTIYDELGGHQGSTSAATYTRRHYERLLLPYEKSTRGEQKDGVRNHTKLKSVKSEDKSDEEKDDVDSPTETSSEKGAENESSKEKSSSGESKTAALRSIRPKMEKVEENIPSDKENIPVSNSLPQVNSPSSIANASANGNSTSGLVNGSLTKTSGTTNCITNGEASSTPTAEISAENDDPKVVPEVIDLASEESQVKIGKSPVPAFKKRKLEILKEGGLEVTAISSLGSETSVTPVVEKRPSVIQHAAPVTAPPSDNNQVSITVTPDVGHILGSPRGEVASTPSPISPFDTSTNHSNVINVQDLKHKMHNQNLPQDAPAGAWSRRFPPKVVQSRSIYTHSESTVYGNPKDIFDPRQLLYSERVPGRMVPHTEEEVLDLRVKSPQKSTLSVNRVHPIAAASVDSPRNLSKTVNKTNNSAFPLLAGRAIVGSNLEITVVDVPKASTNQVKVNPPLPQKPHQPPSRKTTNKTSHRLPPRNENGKFMSMNSQSQSATLHRSTSNSSGGTSLIIPNPYLSSACGRSTPSARTRVSQSQSTVPTSSPSGMIPSFLPGSTSLFPGFLPPVSAANNGGKNSNPFLALSDPLYYSSLYTSHGLYPPSLTPGFVSPLVTPPLFPPSAEQIQLYKELMSQHHTNVRLAQGAANFLGLPRDGSTSITPVGPSTNPSSK